MKFNLKAENKDAIILAIDDNENILELIEAILLSAGFRNIITTTKPDESVDLFNKHNPDVVLLDLNMPLMDGFDVLTALKTNFNSQYLPVIVLTGEDNLEIKVKALRFGAKDFIRKPFEHVEMLARINIVISMSSFYKELIIRNKSLDSVVNEQSSNLLYAVKKKEEAEKQLENILLHDKVTGLPNRYLFEDRLCQLINTGQRNRTKVAVIVLGFDNYTDINNTIGYTIYDDLLRKLTERLKRIIRDSDTVSILHDGSKGTVLSRIGDDMFSIIVPVFETLNDIETIINRCFSSLMEPIGIPDIMFDISMHGGVSCFPDHGATPADLIQSASKALYFARNDNVGYKVYDIATDDIRKNQLNMMADLKNAIMNNDLEIYYQPKIKLSDDSIYGCEALIRWNHSEYGMIPPDDFIPMAEKTGTIRLLTKWVVEKAMSQWSEWDAQGIELKIAINLSAQDLRDIYFVGMVKRSLEKFQVNPICIILEVTETSMMQDMTMSMSTLSQLSKLGVMLSVDDYGTGYSSLAYLKSLPVDEIKIDQSFVLNMDQDKGSNVIVKSTIELAHNLGYRVVAEGIENKETYKILQEYGCDIGQGYYMSRPVPEKELIEWFNEKKALTI